MLITEDLPLGALRFNPRNPKLHANATIGASITRFGMMEPIVIDQCTGFIVSGHGRVETLRALRDGGGPPPDGIIAEDGGDWLVPAVTSWASRDDTEADAALVALNRTTELGGWDTAPVATILAGLLERDGMAGVGYGEADLSLMLKQLDAEGQMTADTSDVIDEFLGITGTGADSRRSNVWRTLIVVFANEEDCRGFFDRLGWEYNATTRSIAWPVPIPKMPKVDYTDE